YEECERVIQRLLLEAGVEGVDDALVSVAADGFEAQADWTNLASPETYLGYEQTQNFASPGGVAFNESRTYVAPGSLRLNQWALSGDWTIESGARRRLAHLVEESGRGAGYGEQTDPQGDLDGDAGHVHD